MKELELASEGLLSKWGFNDGDKPDELLDHLDAIGFTGRGGYLPGQVWHRVLCRLVREHLIPQLDQDVEVATLETNHNPIRAHTVDGADVTYIWRKGRGPRPELTPESVCVPIDVVMAAINEEMTVQPEA
ncbi:hypothetical protein ACFQY7_35885 [Actinomadura luteofluorescens]|uniref:Uncharacterized protein n=1 Tax=Actinomadura luteofluorescens TaxID=46163 RepID=A0A7Y9EJL6_9ACTN|nr:hypothetical protein [Actinomadura luteofluorescens]NYD48884.1 hypothetical protein [Actinomadura luteofluorescens]